MEQIHLRSDLGHMCRAFARTDDERRNPRGFVLYCLELAMGFKRLYSNRFGRAPHGFDAAELAEKTRFSAEELTLDYVGRVCDGREVGRDVQDYQTEVDNMVSTGDRDALRADIEAVRREKEALEQQIRGMLVAEGNGALFAHAEKDARIARLEADLEAARIEREALVRDLGAAQEADRNGKRELERIRLQRAADRGASEEMVLLRRIMQAVATGGVAPAAAGGGGDAGVTDAMNRLRQELDRAKLDLMEERNAKEDAQREGGTKDTEIARLNQLVAAKDAELQRLRGGGGDVAALQARIEALLEIDSVGAAPNGFPGMAAWYDARVDAVNACDLLLVPASLQTSITKALELGYAFYVLDAVSHACARLTGGDCAELDVVTSDRMCAGSRGWLLGCVRSMEGTADSSNYHRKMNGLRSVYKAGTRNGYCLQMRNGIWSRVGVGRESLVNPLYLLDSQYDFLSTTLPLVYAHFEAVAFVVGDIGNAIGLLNGSNVDEIKQMIADVVASVQNSYGNVKQLMPASVDEMPLRLPLKRVFNGDTCLNAVADYDAGLRDVVQYRILLGCTLCMAPADSNRCFPMFSAMDRQAVFDTLTQALKNLEGVAVGIDPVRCSRAHLASIGVTDAYILGLLYVVDP